MDSKYRIMGIWDRIILVKHQPGETKAEYNTRRADMEKVALAHVERGGIVLREEKPHIDGLSNHTEFNTVIYKIKGGAEPVVKEVPTKDNATFNAMLGEALTKAEQVLVTRTRPWGLGEVAVVPIGRFQDQERVREVKDLGLMTWGAVGVSLDGDRWTWKLWEDGEEIGPGDSRNNWKMGDDGQFWDDIVDLAVSWVDAAVDAQGSVNRM